MGQTKNPPPGPDEPTPVTPTPPRRAMPLAGQGDPRAIVPVIVTGDPTPVIDAMLEHLDVDREQLSLALFEIGINPHWPHVLVRKVTADAAERGVLYIPKEIWPGRDEFMDQVYEAMRRPLDDA